MAPPPRLLLVAEDAIARAGLRALAERAGLSVAGDVAPSDLQPSDVEAADAIAWDAGMSGTSRRGARLAARVPVLVLPWNVEQAREALAAGARGVLSRERLEEQLLPAFRRWCSGCWSWTTPSARPWCAPFRSRTRSSSR